MKAGNDAPIGCQTYPMAQITVSPEILGCFDEPLGPHERKVSIPKALSADKIAVLLLVEVLGI